MRHIFIWGCTYLVFLPALAASGAVEEGSAKETPWSGYWWPIAKGELQIPLSKYDQLTGAASAQWERQNHPPGPNVPRWHGYCHAWAASAVLEKEPKKVSQATGPASNRPLRLAVGDQKGLFAAAHARDVSNTYGDRFGDGVGSEDPQDLTPDALWQLLKLYVKQQGIPLILDLEPGAEIWNYPVYAYRIEYSPSGPPGQQFGHLSLWMADNDVPPDYVGVKMRFQTYTFTFQLRNGSIVMGSGRWVGQSQENHPDFAWYPYVVLPENPHIQYTTVQRIMRVSQPQPSAPPSTPPDTPPDTMPDEVPNQNSGQYDPSGSQGGGLLINNSVPLSPIQLVAAIAEETSSFGLDVTVDRFDGGLYTIGEPYTVKGSSERAGYLYLLHIDNQGKVSLLFPAPNEDNRVAAETRFTVPRPGVARLVHAGPVGTHRVKAMVTNRPLMLSGLRCPAQSTGKKGASHRREYRPFRWPPTEQKQVRDLMKQYQQRQQLPPEQLRGTNIAKKFVSFAQDEVAFYVGPTTAKPPKKK